MTKRFVKSPVSFSILIKYTPFERSDTFNETVLVFRIQFKMIQQIDRI